MSVRSEKMTENSTAATMASLELAPSVLTAGAADHVNATIAAAQQADSTLAEANSLNTASPDHPIKRTISVNIRSTLGDLCLRKAKGQWSPTSTALKNMFQKKKFTTLGGSAEGTGDLRSVVLHDLTLNAFSSNFPIPVGASITAVDSNTYSVTGEPFGFIAPSMSSSSARISLQADDTSLAYEFARKVRSSVRLPQTHRQYTCQQLQCSLV